MNVEDLEVYKRAIALVVPADRLATLLEQVDRDLARDVRKTSRQIAPSIAEGFSKRSSQKEFKRFMGISMASTDEMMTHIQQVKLRKVHSVKNETCDALLKHYKILAKQLNRLITASRKNVASKV